MNKIMYLYNLELTKICDLYNNNGTSPRNVNVSKKINEINELSFDISFLNPYTSSVFCGMLIEFDGQIYEVSTTSKEHNEDNSISYSVRCFHYSSTLKNRQIIEASIDPQLPLDALKSILYENNLPKYGWSISTITSQAIYRGYDLKEQSVFETLVQIAELFKSHLEFSSTISGGILINTISLYSVESYTSLESLRIDVNKNLKDVSIEYDSTDMVTRLYCFGGTNPITNMDIDLLGASVNGVPYALTYIENYSYYLNQDYTQIYINSNKNRFLKEGVWRDSDYYDSTLLYTDAVKKLETLSKPKINVKFNSINFNNDYYGFSTVKLGSPVIINDENINLSLQCIVIGITRNFDTPWLYDFEISNIVEYNTLLSKLFKNSNNINVISNNNGTIKPESIVNIPDVIKQELTDITSFTADLQNQIDGNITTWFYDYVPTLLNLPSSDWNTVFLKNNHLGDLFYNNLTGYAYRFQFVVGVYSWQIIADIDVTRALSDAAKAQDTADGKRRVFTDIPYPPYDVGDLWVQGINGDIKSCKIQRLNGAYDALDWEIASKYTDDTAAGVAQTKADTAFTDAATANTLLADIASDSKLTAVEKQQIKAEWDVIVSEKVINDAQAVLFGIVTEKNNYTTAYNTLSAYITPLLASLTTTSDIVGVTFRANFKDYYDKRQLLLNAISTKLKTLAEEAQVTANGKNKVFFQPSTPIASMIGDTWFKTDNGNKIYRWSGIVWTDALLGSGAIANGAIGTPQIANLSITNALIANDAYISSAKIGEIDAGKITTGLLQSIDGKTYFNLNNGEIKETGSKDISKILNTNNIYIGSISTTTGQDVVNAYYARTVLNFFPVQAGTILNHSGTLYTVNYFFYNLAGGFISYTNSVPATAPPNTRFVRFSLSNFGVPASAWVASVNGLILLKVPVTVEMSPINPFKLSIDGAPWIYITSNGTLVTSIYDVNEDGFVNEEDYNIIKNYILNLVGDKPTYLALYPKIDINRDGVCDSTDLALWNIAYDKMGLGVQSAPNITFQNSWVNEGVSFNPCGYYKDRERVYLKGRVKNGTIGQPIFTLPLEYRPLNYACLHVCDSNGAFGRVQINTSGTVVPTTGTNVAFCLDGVSFKI